MNFNWPPCTICGNPKSEHEFRTSSTRHKGYCLSHSYQGPGCQKMQMPPVIDNRLSQNDSYTRMFESINIKQAEKAYVISEGRFTDFEKLLKTEDTSLLTDQAKEFMKANVFERQKIINSFPKDKEHLSNFLSALKLTTKTGMRNSKSKKDRKRWSENLKIVLETEDNITRSVPSKLALLSLSVNMS